MWASHVLWVRPQHMDYREARRKQQEARLQARGATWKGSGRPCTLEFKFDTPESNSTADYVEQVTRKVIGTEDRHSQPDPTALSTSSECAKPSVKSRRNFEKEKLSEPSRSTELAVDNTRPRLQREGSRRKRKAVTDQERRSPETQLSTVVATQETDHIEQPSSRKRKSKLAMKNKETILGTDETGTKLKTRKPKQLVADATGEEQPYPEVRLSKPQRRTKFVADNDVIATQEDLAPSQTSKKRRILRNDVPHAWNIPLEEVSRRVRVEFGLPLDSSRRK